MQRVAEEADHSSFGFFLLVVLPYVDTLDALLPFFGFRHGCAALQALAHRSAVLADLAVCHDGVLLVCKAMRTFRTDKSAGRLCPTFFSSAFVSTPHKYHGFVYRPPPGHFSIGLQASACAVLVKLAEIKRAALQMRQMSAASLLEQVISFLLLFCHSLAPEPVRPRVFRVEPHGSVCRHVHVLPLIPHSIVL